MEMVHRYVTVLPFPGRWSVMICCEMSHSEPLHMHGYVNPTG